MPPSPRRPKVSATWRAGVNSGGGVQGGDGTGARGLRCAFMHLCALRPEDELLEHGHGLSLHVARVDPRDEVADSNLVRSCGGESRTEREVLCAESIRQR